MNIRAMILAALGAAILTFSGGPAGSFSPMILRTVTMGEITGPAFYSVVEGRYLFVGGGPQTVPRAAERLASLSGEVR